MKATIAVVAILAGLGTAHAASTTTTLTIKVSPALTAVFTPPGTTAAPLAVSCDAAVGTTVSTLSVVGGNGGVPTYTMTGGGTNFTLSGNLVKVGSGLAAACGSGIAVTVSVTATQP